jgi:hypothetical protein
MSAVVSFVGDLVEDVVDAVGDVVESVGDVIEDAVEFVGDTVQAVLDDPLPVLLSIAGAAVGIPPMVTNAVVTASRGGDLGDIALSVGTAYFAPVATNSISSTLSSTIGDAIINETVSDVVVDGISKGLVNGTIAEIRGGEFEDGFAGGFTGSVVSAGVGEVSDFVKPEIADAVSDLGFDESTVNQITNIGTKAISAGLTSEITGKNDFATSFTNSVINSTTNLASNSIANTVTNSIGDQFATAEATDKEITGAEDGNAVDQEEVKTSLADAWANRDINEVNNLLNTNSLTADDARTMFDLTDDDMDMLVDSGIKFNVADEDIKTTTDLTSADTSSTFGTGAGIPDSLVDEVDVVTSNDGEDSGTATNVVSSLDETYYSNDIGGTDSVSTISGSDTQSVAGATQDTASSADTGWLDLKGYEDVSDIAETVGDEDTQVASTVTLPEDLQDIVSDTDQVDTQVVETPAGGLTAVSSADAEDDVIVDQLDKEATVTDTAKTTKPVDVLAGLDEGLDVSSGEDKPVDVAGINILDGGLNALSGSQNLTQDTGVSGQKIIAGALNQFLKPAIKKGVTTALTRPVTKTGVRKVQKPATAKTVLTPQQVMAMRKSPAPQKVDVSKLRPTVKAAPTKVDVSKLTPVSNIAGLTSLLANKKG